ncbi:MAG: hypothetical protein NTW80_04250, partial [Deltaproteobacteria bacterium]|nr:hypothetical protein [Deltaproteobacteria bacterium]
DLERRVQDRTAQLEKANKELEGFSYSVSHDLRAPLRAIDGFARILCENYAGPLDPEGLRLLEVICANAVRMAQLIDDLLAFAHLPTWIWGLWWRRWWRNCPRPTPAGS